MKSIQRSSENEDPHTIITTAWTYNNDDRPETQNETIVSYGDTTLRETKYSYMTITE